MVLDLHTGGLQHQLHVGGGGHAGPGGHPAHQLPGGGAHGQGDAVRHRVPHRHIHVPGVFPHLQIHLPRLLSRLQDAAGVVAGLRLVARRRAQAHPLLDGHAAQILLKDAVSVVAAGIGAQAQADDHRPAQLPGPAEDVLHPQHHGAGLVGVLLVRRHAVPLPVEGPGRTQLDGDDLRVRGRAGKGLALPPGGHRGQERAVAHLIPLRHQIAGRAGGQGGVDIRLAVLPAQQEPLRGIPLGGLVVDVPDPAGAVLVAEYVLGVVDARVHKADEHPPALQVQVGLAVDLGHPRRLQGGPVQQPQHHGHGADKGRPQRLLEPVEVGRLDVAQHVPPGEHLPHHHVGGVSHVVEKGVRGTGDKVHGVRRMDKLQGLRRQAHTQIPLSKWLTSSFMVPHRFSRP